MATAAESNKSATSTLREWMRDRISLAGEVKIKELGEEGIQFLAEDQDRLNQFVTERVYDMAAEIGRAVLLETRRIKRFYEADATTDEERQARLGRWFQRMEHQPIRGNYMRLQAMTRQDLLAAAEEREKRATVEMVTARWYRLLAAGMTDEQTVRDRYTPEQVARFYDSASDSLLANLNAIINGAQATYDTIMNSETPDAETDESA
jgi:hypothetical protein